MRHNGALADTRALQEALGPLGEPSPGYRRRSFTLLSWSDGVSVRASPDLVKGFLPDGLSVVYGPPGCGKSFLAIDLAAAIAQQVPWRGLRVRGGPVAIIAAEAQAGIWKRLDAYRLERMTAEAELPPLYVLPEAPVMLEPGGEVAPVVRKTRPRFAASGALGGTKRVKQV